MKPAILLLSVTLLIFTSCTTSYKTGQTPDDVYFSERTHEEYARNDRDRDEERYSDEYYEDRYLRMKVRNRYRWNELDDWYYTDYRFRSNVYLGCCMCDDPWSPYSYWNTRYNPYYQPYVVIKNVRTAAYSKPRTFNLNAYNPNNNQTKNYRATTTSSTSNNRYIPRSTNSNNGNRLRDIFRGSGSSSSGNSGTKTSSNSSSSSSSGSKSSGSSGSAPVRRF